MPVQTDINSLSTTPSSNSPTGGEAANLVDDYLRQASAHIATLNAGKAPSSHSHAKADVGLSNVDNTSDADKPVSNAVAAAFVRRDGAAAMTGALLVPDGAASAPALAFSGASNTGFYRSVNTVFTTVSGVARCSIDSNAALQLIPDGSGTARIQVPSSAKMQIGVGSGSALFIDSDQSVYLGPASNSIQVGYLGVPRHFQFGGTIARTAVGKVVYDTPTVNYTLNTGVFSAGDSFWILHYGSGYAIQVIQGSGMSILLGGNGGAAGTRNLASNCLAFVHFKSSTECVITGVGVS